MVMPDSLGNLDKARRYLKAMEAGDGAYLAELFSPDALVEQLPNRIYPRGMRTNFSQMADAFEKGRRISSRRGTRSANEARNGNTVALEVLGTGKLAVSFGRFIAPCS
jgi:ketosteroid isomerase-like protein